MNTTSTYSMEPLISHGVKQCTELVPASGLGEATIAQYVPIWPNCPEILCYG